MHDPMQTCQKRLADNWVLTMQSSAAGADILIGWCQQAAISIACLLAIEWAVCATSIGDLDVDRVCAFCCQDWAAILQMTRRVLCPIALTAAAWLDLVALWHNILVKGHNRHLQAHQSRQ